MCIGVGVFVCAVGCVCVFLCAHTSSMLLHRKANTVGTPDSLGLVLAWLCGLGRFSFRYTIFVIILPLWKAQSACTL